MDSQTKAPDSEKPKSNIPAEIAGAETKPLTVPQDEETSKLVNEFLAGKGAPLKATDASQPESGAEPTPVAQVDITPNRDFEGGDPNGEMIGEALAPIDKIVISEDEKAVFLKAVLNDEPVRMTVSLYNGKFKIEMRSRTTFEQKRVFDILKQDEKEGIYDKGDIPAMITRMHYYLAVLMVERINGDLFSEMQLKQGKKIEEDVASMREAADKTFPGMGNVRWTSILNGLRIFEHKCAKLNSEAANEGFWNPQGSA